MSKTKLHNYKSNITVPCDILFCILIRLPVKSLLRFQSISMSWNALISGYEFKKTHRDQSKALGRGNILLERINDDVLELRDLVNPTRKLELPAKRFGHTQALCSCDGLVLLDYAYKNKTYALWNPHTNEYGIFECPYLDYYGSTTPHACGFCYDSSVDEYKVVLICESFYAIGYVTNNYWRKETCIPWKVQTLDARSRECSPGINIDGCVFWSLDWKIHQLVRRDSIIIYFDVKSDELKEFLKPDFIAEDELFCLTALKGYVGLYGGNNWRKELNFWIMKQDRWTFSMKIDCYIPSFFEQFVENSERTDGTILFRLKRLQDQHFVIYDPEQQQYFKRVQIFKDSKHYIVHLCSESLYFPKPKRIVWS